MTGKTEPQYQAAPKRHETPKPVLHEPAQPRTSEAPRRGLYGRTRGRRQA